jgi:hypothetical protein
VEYLLSVLVEMLRFERVATVGSEESKSEDLGAAKKGSGQDSLSSKVTAYV